MIRYRSETCVITEDVDGSQWGKFELVLYRSGRVNFLNQIAADIVSE